MIKTIKCINHFIFQAKTMKFIKCNSKSWSSMTSRSLSAAALGVRLSETMEKNA